MNLRSLGIIALLLFLALIGTVIWGFGKANQVTELSEANVANEAEVEQMTLLRDRLAAEVETLSAQYTEVTATNEELQGQLTTAQQELRRTQSAYQRALKVNANDKEVAFEMRKQIEDLITVRSDLERSIRVVASQNDSLLTANTLLKNRLGVSEDENRQLAELNRRMESEIGDLTLKNFKATAFQVDLLQRGGEKLTAKSGRVRRIVVSFDLTSVPAQYQGVRPLYLVITDQAGTPIGGTDIIPVKATVNGQQMDLKPVRSKDINVEDSQRINLTYDLEDKLASGFYRAQVFTDIGLLGASSFRLR